MSSIHTILLPVGSPEQPVPKIDPTDQDIIALLSRKFSLGVNLHRKVIQFAL